MAKATHTWTLGLLTAALVACGPVAPSPGGPGPSPASQASGPSPAAPSQGPSQAPAGGAQPSPSPSPSPTLAQGPWRQVAQAPVGDWVLVGASGREDAAVASLAGQVAFTSSGGGSWTLSQVPLVPDDRLVAVGYLGDRRIWAAGRFGAYLLSADGRFWARHFDFRSLETFTAEGVALANDGLMVAAGRGETTRLGPAVVLESQDLGRTWRVAHRVAAEPGLGAVGGGGQALVRTNKGWLQRSSEGSWGPIPLLAGGNAACAVALGPEGAVMARASQQGLVVGSLADLRLLQPGAQWQGGLPSGCEGRLALSGRGRAWYAEGQQVWRSEDGGKAWVAESAGAVPTQALAATPEGGAWAVGQQQVWAFQ